MLLAVKDVTCDGSLVWLVVLPVQADKAVLLAERKRGVDTFVASYSVRDQDTMLSWQRKPFKVWCMQGAQQLPLLHSMMC
jgi:hypothetical protein